MGGCRPAEAELLGAGDVLDGYVTGAGQPQEGEVVVGIAGGPPGLVGVDGGDRRPPSYRGGWGPRWHALMLGWPTDVEPMAVLSVDGDDLPGATPTTCLVLAACIGCCWPHPDIPLLPGVPVPEDLVLDALAGFTRPGRPVSESLATRRMHWKPAIRRLRACGFLMPEAGE